MKYSSTYSGGSGTRTVMFLSGRIPRIHNAKFFDENLFTTLYKKIISKFIFVAFP